MAGGYRQFLYAPLHSTYGIANSVAAFGTKSAGFDDEEIRQLRLIQAPLARVVETLVQYESTIQILSTYVGRDAGQRVLRGNIQRGHTEEIAAVILFSDIKNFTAMSNSCPPAKVIETLNIFYDIVESAIGPEVNLASRLMSTADELDVETVFSGAFGAVARDWVEFLGERRFKGFAELQKIFGLRT